MRLRSFFLLALPLFTAALTPVQDAAACGGCFPDLAQSGQTQVSGHRMVLSISKTQSTLWDQISYSGDPASFAWVLPIKGQVTVGTSSDALFGNLERLTTVNVSPPSLNCASPPYCGWSEPSDDPSVDLPGAGAGVTVIAQEVVGPYETAQLSSQNPDALKTWLTDHGYAIPADISPLISAYVTEGFDFLALKLVPGQGIQSMKPVRVTTPGASPVLPLRMVAAGAGATVPITLWVVGEGQYRPSTFPFFTIPEDQLIWDWNKKESNYKELRQFGFTASQGRSFLIEAGEPVSENQLSVPLLNLAEVLPEDSGYGDAMGKGALEEAEADVGALLNGISFQALTVTRLRAELPKDALSTDLTLQAAANQTPVKRFFQATKALGQPPACPVYPPCPSVPGAGGVPDSPSEGMSAGCACTAGGEAGAPAALFGALLSLGLIVARRRARAGRAA